MLPSSRKRSTELFCVFKTIPEFNEKVICLSEAKWFSINDSQLSRTSLFNQDRTVVYNNQFKYSTFISPVFFFSLAGNIIVYRPSQGTNREKYFYHINYKDKRCRFWWEINTFPSISSLIGCVFSIFPRKKYEPNLSGHQSAYSRTDTINTSINKKSKLFP